MTINFWQNAHVRLRAIEPSDTELFVRWNQDSERARHLDFLWPPQSIAAVEQWVHAQALRKFDGDVFHWVIENPQSIAVGTISTHDCNPRYGTFSYGLDIAPEHRRQGYARAAIQLILSYYFGELRYQKATVAIHADNVASLRLHAQLGFQPEGVLRRMFYTHGRYVDVHWWGMTVEEFNACRLDKTAAEPG
jgi:RimJ/RimL family protein N-acetyltransferase